MRSLSYARSVLGSRDFGRPTFFDCTIIAPISTGPGFTISKDISMITGFSIPSITMNTANDESQIKRIQVATYFNIDDFTVNFIATPAYFNYKAIRDWMDYIFNINTRKLRYFDDYVGAATLSVGNIMDDSSRRFIGDGVFPKTLSDLTTGHDKRGQLMEFSATFYIHRLIII